MHAPVSRGTRRGLINGTLALGLLLVTGCGDNTAGSAPGALAVIVGAHSNMVAPSLVDTVQAEIDTAAERGSPATVIVNDGSPTVSTSVSLKAANPVYQQDQVDQLKSLIDKTRADNPEADLLAAISLAARSVTDAAGPRTIVVIDSGLQTTGALRFQDQDGALLHANPDEVIDSASTHSAAAQSQRDARRVHRARRHRGPTAATACVSPDCAGDALDENRRIGGR